MEGNVPEVDFELLQGRIQRVEQKWHNAVRTNLQSLRFNEEITNIRFELHPNSLAAQEV